MKFSMYMFFHNVFAVCPCRRELRRGCLLRKQVTLCPVSINNNSDNTFHFDNYHRTDEKRQFCASLPHAYGG